MESFRIPKTTDEPFNALVSDIEKIAKSKIDNLDPEFCIENYYLENQVLNEKFISLKQRIDILHHSLLPDVAIILAF